MRGLVLRGVVYTMDCEVVPGSCKICDWLLNSSWDQFGLYQGKHVRVIMVFEVPRRCIVRPTLFTGMVRRILQWEGLMKCFSRKRRGPMAKKWCYDFIFFFSEVFYGEEKVKTREDNKLDFFFQKCPFWAYIKKQNQHIYFWYMLVPRGPHSVYT